VARALENVGFYVVDNLPQALLLDMAELAFQAGGAASTPRWCSTLRSRAFSIEPGRRGARPARRGFQPRVLFVDADDEVLSRWFENVRRSHPLQGDGRLPRHRGRARALTEARESADVSIDTSHLNVNQLRARVEEMFRRRGQAAGCGSTVLSFGFLIRAAADADFVWTPGSCQNPYWDPGSARSHRPRT
jgi:UPF0042 nucleotide-binding protein